MRKHFSLLLTASFLFLNNWALASSSNNDDDNDIVQHAVSTPQPVTSEAGEPHAKRRRSNAGNQIVDGATTEERSNLFSNLPHLVRMEIMKWLHNDPQGQLSLMNISHGMRRLALQMPSRYNDAISTGNDLKKHLFKVLIGGQTGDVALFMADQKATFGQLTLPQLQESYESRYYNGTLSPDTKHGREYRSVNNESIEESLDENNTQVLSLLLGCSNLRLVPLNFPGVETINNLDINNMRYLRIPPCLSHLSALKDISMDGCNFILTPNFSGLITLESILLGNCNLQTPPTVSELIALEHLELQDNQLQEAPNLTGLTALKRLELHDNPLKQAPNISGLINLNELLLDAPWYANPTLREALSTPNANREPSEKIDLGARIIDPQTGDYCTVSINLNPPKWS